MYERVTLVFGLRQSVLIFCQPGPETTSERSSFKVIFIEIKKENMILTDLQKAFQDCARTDNSFIALTCMFFFLDHNNKYYTDFYTLCLFWKIILWAEHFGSKSFIKATYIMSVPLQRCFFIYFCLATLFTLCNIKSINKCLSPLPHMFSARPNILFLFDISYDSNLSWCKNLLFKFLSLWNSFSRQQLNESYAKIPYSNRVNQRIKQRIQYWYQRKEINSGLCSISINPFGSGG